jgi:hypothetical protein
MSIICCYVIYPGRGSLNLFEIEYCCLTYQAAIMCIVSCRRICAIHSLLFMRCYRIHDALLAAHLRSPPYYTLYASTKAKQFWDRNMFLFNQVGFILVERAVYLARSILAKWSMISRLPCLCLPCLCFLPLLCLLLLSFLCFPCLYSSCFCPACLCSPCSRTHWLEF